MIPNLTSNYPQITFKIILIYSRIIQNLITKKETILGLIVSQRIPKLAPNYHQMNPKLSPHDSQSSPK